MDHQGIAVESGSLKETFWKRAIESEGLKEGLEQDQLGVGEGLSLLPCSYNEIHLKNFASNSHFKSSLCIIWMPECWTGFRTSVSKSYFV